MAPATLKRYRIVRLLGQGGMGGVYLAEDTTLGRQVALKGLPEHLASSAEDRERLRREARAVAAAHGKGIIHRDLKPANVMVAADRRAKILDFGPARLREAADAAADRPTQSITGEGRIVGAAAYMSPEQVEGCGTWRSIRRAGRLSETPCR